MLIVSCGGGSGIPLELQPEGANTLHDRHDRVLSSSGGINMLL